MIHITISPEDLKRISTERFTQSDPIISRRLHVLYFKSLNIQHQKICEYADISPAALIKVLKKYAKGGLDEVMRMNWKPKRAVLDDHVELLKKHFHKQPPESVKVAGVEIEKLTGVKRGKTQTRRFLHKIGMKPRKVAGIPSKADPEKQELFKKKHWSLP
jgi:transposase